MNEGPEDDLVAALRMVAFVGAYFVVTSATIYTTRFSGGLAIVWLGTGILVGYFMYLPPALWPRALFFSFGASATATTLFGFGMKPALPLAAINVSEVVLIVLLLRHLRPQLDFLDRVGGFIRLVLAAGIAGPVCAGAVGAIAVVATVGGTWQSALLDWVGGHGLGTLLTAPLALMAARGGQWRFKGISSPGAWTQLVLLATAAFVATAIAFIVPAYPLLFLTVVPLMAASFFLGWTGAAVSLLVIATTSSICLAQGLGPLVGLPGDTTGHVLFLQFYLAVMMMIALPIATVLSHREQLLAQLIKREALHGVILEHSDDAMLTIGSDGIVGYASRAAHRLSGESELVGRRLRDLTILPDSKLVELAFADAAALPGKTQLHEHRIVRDDDAEWIESKICAFTDGKGALDGFVVVAREITRHKEQEVHATAEEETDPLTRLPNRRRFFKELKDSLALGPTQPFLLGVIDIDDFRSVNERFGRGVGDMVLKHLAKAMGMLASDSAFFARLAGDEFGLIVRDGDRALAEAICERLRQAVGRQDSTDFAAAAPQIAISTGFARITEACSMPEAMRAADDALLAAKFARSAATRSAA